jgi:hypothetical protein
VKTFDVFEELFADDFVDHIPRPNTALLEIRQTITVGQDRPINS